ncbi:hypothetical protein [Methyloceanibacter caenitepidi]|uniref:Uncharacterized protein n=1 Tax=Methyloceanibacter caenitepidi TaxID=1384459 RepID=A0A0A8K2D4_9HYPH|nr:hypothetical protein [Methyloceanibacter caenitepidi]BAQ16906.1 hypothetical protein GL4_1450 [Methyloceanibacter caenitepidi]
MGLLDILGGGSEPAGTIDTTGTTSQKTSSRSRSSTQTDVPDFLKSLLYGSASTGAGALNKLRRLSNGDLVADFTDDQLAGFDLARGFGGSEPYSTALDTILGTARGDYLFGGDAFDAAVDASVRAAQPHILSTFGAAGRGTGGLAQTAIARAATDAFAEQYGTERGRQVQAASLLPELGLLPIDLLLQTGAAQQGQAQREITAPIAAQQDLFRTALGGLPIASLLGQTSTGSQTGTSSGTTSQQQPYFENEAASGLGLALSGLGLASGLGSTLFGAEALSGGLLGLLGNG